jgi:hypothetical protein
VEEERAEFLSEDLMVEIEGTEVISTLLLQKMKIPLLIISIRRFLRQRLESQEEQRINTEHIERI